MRKSTTRQTSISCCHSRLLPANREAQGRRMLPTCQANLRHYPSKASTYQGSGGEPVQVFIHDFYLAPPHLLQSWFHRILQLLDLPDCELPKRTSRHLVAGSVFLLCNLDSRITNLNQRASNNCSKCRYAPYPRVSARAFLDRSEVLFCETIDEIGRANK
jgi:hypothetical protein